MNCPICNLSVFITTNARYEHLHRFGKYEVIYADLKYKTYVYIGSNGTPLLKFEDLIALDEQRVETFLLLK